MASIHSRARASALTQATHASRAVSSKLRKLHKYEIFNNGTFDLFNNKRL
jgi:hypothetical protein